MYQEEDYLLISGIMDFTVCNRRWALHNIENIWEDNWRTVDGSIMHENAHDESFIEKRADCVQINALKISSSNLGITGECDVVKFFRDEKGAYLKKYQDYYIPYPIEYKRGNGQFIDGDILQLCAQAMCLEEMLNCKIQKGALFYGETHRRKEICFSADIRDKVLTTLESMHKLNATKRTPKAQISSFCNQCSLVNTCLPKISVQKSVKNYLIRGLNE